MSKSNVAVVAILFSEGYIWLAERLDKDRPYFGMLAAPGGSVNAGEWHENAIQREVKEETGLEITSDRFHYGGQTNHAYSDGRPFFMHWFLVRLNLGEVPARTEPHKQGEWKRYTTAELGGLDVTPGTIGAIDGLLGIRR